jgi:hypothetical protein
MLPPQQPESENWYIVPDWLAGEWQYFEATQYKMGKKGRPQQTRAADHGMVRWGCIQDRSGVWWDTHRVPFVTRSESAANHVVQTVFKASARQRTANEFEAVTEAVLVSYSKATGVITSVNRTTCRGVYMPTPNGTIHGQQAVESSIHGKLVLAVEHYRFTPPVFNPIWPDGTDLRPSFARYLTEHGMAHLVP